MNRASIDLRIDIAADWRTVAACAQLPSQLFFPGSDVPEAAIEKATAVCEVCPVQGPCLEYALETNQRSGIWGGVTEDERRSLRRKWLAERRRAQ